MYLFNELLLSIPLVIYVGWRLRRLIARRALKNLSTVLLALLAAGYPAAESLAHGAVGGAKKVLILAGYYALPLVLYFIMTVLLVDLVIAILRLSKAVSRQTVQSEKFRRGRLALVLALPVLVVAAGIVNANVLRVRGYTVEVPRRSSAVREVKVAFASDLHLSGLTPKDWLAKFVDKINAQKPDIVLIGGDILEGHGDDGAMGVYETQFKRLEARYGVFAVPGNHEGYARTKPEFFDSSGIRLLQDAGEKIDDAFYLIGRKDGRSRNRKSVEELLVDAPGNLPIIMLEHRGSTFIYRGTPTTASFSRPISSPGANTASAGAISRKATRISSSRAAPSCGVLRSGPSALPRSSSSAFVSATAISPRPTRSPSREV
jgi:uncharacterized membrane protein